MSALESFIWHVLGYASMPAIFIGGFVAVAVVFCFLMEKTGRD